MNKLSLQFILFFALLFVFGHCKNEEHKPLDMENYYAWCIVPFDNQNRTPEQRIEMLKNLGFTSYAYDWRQENIPEMVQEFKLAQQNNINIKAVWMWIDRTNTLESLSTSNKQVFNAIEVTGIKPQIWMSFPEEYFEGLSDEERLEKAVKMVDKISGQAEQLDCTVGLYNHGGWFGNPENLVKIIKALPDREIGIIFNFHHAHEMLDEFPKLVKTMKPYLWAVNLNGMNPNGPQIVTIGDGKKEGKMIKVLQKNGFDGPYGILGHREDADVEKVLQANLEGLEKVLNE